MGDNGSIAFNESQRFMEVMKAKCDSIAVLRGSPWIRKAYGLMTRTDLSTRSVSKYLHGVILRDPKKCDAIDREELKSLSGIVPEGVPESDVYLVETYLEGKCDLLVTSDEVLYGILSEGREVKVSMRQDFLREYIR